jgi:hypothetical protein
MARAEQSVRSARGFSVPFIWVTVSPLSSGIVRPPPAGVNRTEVLAQTFPPPSNAGRLAQSLLFKTPYVWDDRRPRTRVKERSACRAVGHVHERRLDAPSDVMVTAVLPV